MAFFSLTDIKFNKNANRTSSEFAFGLESNKYITDNKRYPSDLGAADKGHYMVFYINIQERSIGQDPALNGAVATTETVPDATQNNGFGAAAGNIVTNAINSFNQAGAKVDNSIVNSVLSGLGNIASSIESGLLGKTNFFRTTKRTTDSIALYMPDTLAFDYQQSFTGTSVTKDLGAFGGIVQAGASLMDQAKSDSGLGNKVSNMAPFAAEALFKNNNTLFTALTSVTGGVLAINPQLEVIYQSPDFRKFRFQFMFYPRSEEEAGQVLDIIDLFRYHQAPEIMKSSYGRYLIPPSEFDVKFYYNGVENPNIHKISNCVLTDLALDFAPNGYQSYETLSNKPERGGTGMPVAIRMDLSFTETEIQTKQSIKKSIPNKNLRSIFGKNNGVSTGGNGVSTGDFAFGEDEDPINQNAAGNAAPVVEDLTAANPDVNVVNVNQGESI